MQMIIYIDDKSVAQTVTNETLASMFRTSIADCPVHRYQLSSNLTNPLVSEYNANIKLDQFSNLKLDLKQQFVEQQAISILFYIVAETKSLVRGYYKVQMTVVSCNSELVFVG